jgi:serine phosphatase RsbU (regulator of sigma subunit)
MSKILNYNPNELLADIQKRINQIVSNNEENKFKTELEGLYDSKKELIDLILLRNNFK